MLPLSKRFVLKVMTIIGAWATATCEAQKIDLPQGSPEAAAEAMWRAVSTTCSVSGGLSATFQRYVGPGIVEYRDIKKSVFPWQLTKADELNGVRSKALAVFRASAYRTYKPSEGTWSSWRAPTDNRNSFASESLFRTKDYDYDWPEWTIVLMERHDDRWSYLLTQVPMRNGIWGNQDAISASKLFDMIVSKPLDLAALSLKAPTQSCAELTSKNPKGSVETGRNKPDPTVSAPQVSMSGWIALSDFALFVGISEDEFRRAATWESDGKLAAEIQDRASLLDSRVPAAKTLGPPTRFQRQMINGRPLVIGGAFVVRLEDGRPGLVPERTR
jgi:hypothetical protein